MPKLTVLCDVHDVVADLVTPWLKRYNRDFDDVLTLDDIKSWFLPNWVAKECGSCIYEYLKDPRLFAEMDMIDGAARGVATLRAMGHRVVFVTAGAGPGYLPTVEWLVRYGFVPDKWEFTDVVSAADKSLIRGDIIIDDRPSTIQAFPGGKILFDRPWNRDLEMSALGHRARGWRDIDMIVGIMAVNRELEVGKAHLGAAA